MGRHTEAGLVDRLIDDLAKANQKIGELQGQLKGAIRYSCPKGKHGDFWAYAPDVVCPWCTIVDLRQKAPSNTGQPAPAPRETPCATGQDPDATQLMSSAEIRKATGNDDTAEQAAINPAKTPDVAFEIPARTTWGTKTGDTQALEEWATAPGALPGAGPADIPNSAGLQAVTRVLATTSTD